MATKDLSALPKQLGDVSQQLQQILGLFNSLNGVVNQLGNTIQGGFGQTPKSANLATSEIPDQQKQAMAQSGKAPVVDRFGNRFSDEQISAFKKAQDAGINRITTNSSATNEQNASNPVQQLITQSQHQQTFNPSPFLPQQQYGIKDIPRLMADLQKSSSLEEKASKQIERLKSDPNTQLAATSLQSTIAEFSKITNEIKNLTSAINKAEAGTTERTRLEQQLIEKMGEFNRKQDDAIQAERDSRRIDGGGPPGGGGIRGFFDRHGGKIQSVTGGLTAAAHVGAELYQGYLQAGIGYGQTVKGGEVNLQLAMSDNLAVQARRASESKNLTNYDNLMKYKGDQIIGSNLGSFLGEAGEKRALDVAVRDQNFNFEMMRREHESGAFGNWARIGIGALGLAGGLAATVGTGGMLPLLMGGAAIAGGGASMLSGATNLFKMENEGVYNLLQGNLKPGEFGFENEAGYARSATMMEMRNSALRKMEELSKAQAEAVRPLVEPGVDTHFGLVRGRMEQTTQLGEYAIGEDDIRKFLNPAGLAAETTEQMVQRTGLQLPIQQLTKPEEFSVVPQENKGPFPNLRMPVKSGIITGDFFESRNRNGVIGQHNGVDLRARAGEDVLAPFEDMSDVNVNLNSVSKHMQFLKKVGDKTYGVDYNHVTFGRMLQPDQIRKMAEKGLPIAVTQDMGDQSHLDMKTYELVDGKKQFLNPEENKQFWNQVQGIKGPGDKIIPNYAANTSVNYAPSGDAGVPIPFNPNRPQSMNIINPFNVANTAVPLAVNTGQAFNPLRDLMITPLEMQKYANTVAQTMGPGVVSRSGILDKTTEVVNLSKAGMGNVEQLSQNLIDINKTTGGRESTKDLENIMAAAVAAGFDRSRLGQEFIQTSIQLSKNMDVTSTKYISERLAGGMGFATPFGQVTERDLENTQRGMVKLHSMTAGTSGAIGAGKAYAFFASGGRMNESAFANLSTTQASAYLEELKSGKITSEDLQYQINNIANMRGVSQEKASKIAEEQISGVGKVGGAIPFQYMNQISQGRLGTLLQGMGKKPSQKQLAEFRDAAATAGITTFGDSAVGLQAAQSMLEYSGVQLSASDMTGFRGKVTRGRERGFDKATADKQEFDSKSFLSVSEKMTEALSKGTSNSINNLVNTISNNLKGFNSEIIGKEIANAVKEVLGTKPTSTESNTPTKQQAR